MRRTWTVLGTVAAVTGAVLVAQLLPGATPVARADGLKPYTGCGELLAHYRAELAESATAYGFGYGRGWGMWEGDVAMPTAPGRATGGVQLGSSDAVGRGGTGTNLQEQGVDEPDRVKLKDGRLVVMAQGRLQVVTAESSPRVVGSLKIGGDEWWAGELLLVGDRVLAILPTWRREPQPAGAQRDSRIAYPRGAPVTKLVLADLSTDQPKLIEQAEYDGQYVSARLVGDTVRVVTTSWPQPPATYPRGGSQAEMDKSLAANRAAANAMGLDVIVPRVVRRAADGRVLERSRAVSCQQTTHADNPRGAATLLIATLQPAKGLGAVDRTAVTTDGDLVYASADRLYVATSRWGTTGPARRGVEDAKAPTAAPTDEVTTELHAFATTDSARTTYVASGSVPGYVMGRWALSEHKGALRVATTRQPPWDGSRTQTATTSSMVVKLDERGTRLVETGRVEGLGKTERIQAVRYFGDVAAVVTFRQTDPLYLLDLSGAPKVLGELKVPGFSQYLHPIGDGLLVGLGMEATGTGQVTGTQLSVFDISNLSAPRQVDRLQLGQGSSPAQSDSRAFGYDPQRRMITFAWQSWSRGGGTAGALGVRVGTDGRLVKVGTMPGNANTQPDRVMSDGTRVYAVSAADVVAGDAATMNRLGAVIFPR